VTIGVLALQGDFARHTAALTRCGVRAAEVRKPAELDDVEGLIVPGGESTTLLTLLRAWDFGPAIEAFHASGRPLFGTCAGLILLAREVEHPRQPSLGLIDLQVERNAYGRQRESFEVTEPVDFGYGPTAFRMTFIRAPRIRTVGPGVRVLGRHAGDPVLVREGTVLAASFHPELSDDLAVHQYFCAMARGHATRPVIASPVPPSL
jgi:5'-phosphate synthase pdxT subunit